LLKAKAGSGLGGAIWRDDVQMFRANGHDTTLLMMRTAWLTFVYLFDDGKWRKSLFSEPLILPQRWYVDGATFMWVVEMKDLSGNRSCIGYLRGLLVRRE
jgi:hypothetical protein